MAARSRFSARSRALSLGALAILTGVATLLAAEAALRALSLRPKLETEWLLGRPDMLRPGPIFFDPATERDVYYETRDRPIVVALGDSFTQGYPVSKADSYPAVLADLAAERDIPVSVIAICAGNTGPDQQLHVFEHELLPRLTPDVVVWQLYANDIGDNVSKAVFSIDENRLVPIDGYYNWLYWRQRLHGLVPFAEWLVAESYVYRFLLKAFERLQILAVPREHRDHPEVWALEKIRLVVDRMRGHADRNGFRFYVLLIAPQSAYLDAEARREDEISGFTRRYRQLRDMLSNEPGFIDAVFRGADGVTLDGGVFMDDGRDPGRLGGRHFDEQGYRRLAELVLARLVADGELR